MSMEMGNCNNPKTFLLCAWNYFERKEDKAKGKKYHWKKDCLVKCLATYFDAMGLREVKTEGSAQIVVVAPRDFDVPLTLDDLFFFHSMLSSRPKKVLYVHQTAPSAFHAGYINRWCFFVQKSGFSIEDLQKWLKDSLWNGNDRLQHKPKEEELQSWNQFLIQAVNPRGRKLSALIKSLEKELKKNDKITHVSRSGFELLKDEKSVSRFYYGLLRISGKHAELEHVLNRHIAAGELDKNSRTNFQRLKRFIDACVDLRSALTVLGSKDFSSTQPNGVLLIDDRPDLVRKELCGIFSSFLPDLELMAWNPENPKKLASKNQLLIENIERYTSLLSTDDILLRKMNLSLWTEDKESEPKKFSEIIPKVRFVIVDILFKEADGREVEKGYDVICGLHRIFRDFHEKLKERKKERASDRKEYGLPEIIAISRANDMDKAHAAFLKGASGYVLKSRMLALPSALGRAQYAALEPADTVHRNFRLLYNLPHETIGLLRAATISPVLRFHDFLHGNNQKSRIKASLPMANLLAAIPKADLHVHVGSCMSPEFLVVASLVMLVRHKPDSEKYKDLQKAIPELVQFLSGKAQFKFHESLNVGYKTKDDILSFDKKDKRAIHELANKTRKYLEGQISYYEKQYEKNKNANLTNSKNYKQASKAYKLFRSILHKDFSIPDHLDEKHLLNGLKNKPDVTMFQFAMTHSGPNGNPLITDKDDLLRIFLLFLAANKDNKSNLEMLDLQINYLSCFKPDQSKIDEDKWKELYNIFWSAKEDKRGISPDEFRSNNWRLKKERQTENQHKEAEKKKDKIRVKIKLFRSAETSRNLWPLDNSPDYDNDPIAYLLATGMRCSNLKTYLEGCEYSGAEHLRHPYLIHLYAQQTAHEFARQGVMYAELRAAVSGYENREINFTFQDACNCLQEAFHNAQHAILKEYHESRIKKDEGEKKTSEEDKPVWLWKKPFGVKTLFKNLNSKQSRHRFPIKISIILTGKRHKPTRQMLREAASATVLHTLPSSDIKTAQKFATEDMNKCRLVGFDLAGQEDDDHAPHLFRSEFEQISKMHIPITVHAGENAPAGFVESAVLDLRARRIGHGLALIEDKQLMNRLREDGVCVELCPVSNFQTNQFVPADGKSLGREYPLQAFLKNGNAVCLNTDNPIISYTNMVKECFQASYAFGGKGLSLWELLRILRMGFVHSFLSLPERRSMLELADQILFDLFSDSGVVEDLRCMAACRDEKKGNIAKEKEKHA